MKILIKSEDLTAVTYEEHLEKMTLYYGSGKMVIMHDIKVEDYQKVEKAIKFNDITNSNRENNSTKSILQVGLKFYNTQDNIIYDVIKIYSTEELILLKRVDVPNNWKYFYVKIDDFYTYINNKVFLKCINEVPEDYRKCFYINKQTNVKYKCCGWNYGCIYLYVEDNNEDRRFNDAIVLVDNLLESFWIIEKTDKEHFYK